MKNAADWDRVKRLFDEALNSPDRAKALAGVTPELRAEVEELLAAHDRAPDEPVREGPGASIGRYRLLQQIGEGGFGVVYMAEQTEPVSRKVALKVLKAGMDTGQVVARFEAERQALALMDHPNIAKVYDAGTAESGRPYFVMELVRGVPITQYCDEAQLDTAARLALFVHVCHAVQHAHQKGIIHRDLKPSNVMVTLHDGEPVPKVIDFGIAKALDRKLTEKTLFTEFRQMIGTPEYMAPEQAELSGLDIDTRADIYSLGVLLYEILTGTKPFDIESLMERGYGEILRTIREVDPPKPSTRVSTLGEELQAVAKKRHTPPAGLGKLLRGDLDWIVMKALEKDRSRRYETADGFAMDIRRHLADEPVLASPPTALYRARKYVRRHRLGVSAAAVVAAALVAGVTVAAFGWAEASVQRRQAEDRTKDAIREAARARAVLDLVQEMVGSADPDRVKGREYTVRQLLDDFDRGLGGRLKGEPAVEATIRATIGRAYMSLGVLDRAEPHLKSALEIRGRTDGEDSAAFAEALFDWASLARRRGDLRRAEESFRRTADIRERVLGAEDPSLAVALADWSEALAMLGRFADARARAERALAIQRKALVPGGVDLSKTLVRIATAQFLAGDFAAAESLAKEALAIRRREVGDRHPLVGDALLTLANIRLESGDVPAAEALLREAVDLARAVYGDAHPCLAEALIRRSLVLQRKGDLAAAEKDLREAMAMLTKTVGAEHPLMALAMDGLGMLKANAGELEEAERICRESLALRRRVYGPRHFDVATNLQNLAATLAVRGDLAAAETYEREAMEIRTEVFGADHAMVAEDLHNLAFFAHQRGDDTAALALCARAEAIRRKAFGGVHPALAAALNLKSDIQRTMLDPDGAERSCRESLAIARALPGGGYPDVTGALTNLATFHWAKGEFDETQKYFQEAFDLDLKALGEEHPLVAVRRANLARLLRDRGDLDAAERGLTAALDVQRRTVGEDHVDVALTLSGLGNVARDRGRFKEAEDFLRRAIEIDLKASGPGSPGVASFRGNLAEALKDAGRIDEAEAAARETLAHRKAEEAYGALGACLIARQRWADAEEALRECVRIRRIETPGAWTRWEAESLLGESLAAQRKFDEAEPLLLASWERMKPPAPYADRRRDALERIVKLYDAWEKPEKASEWKARREAK